MAFWLERWGWVLVVRRSLVAMVLLAITIGMSIPAIWLRVDNSVEYFIGSKEPGIAAYDGFRRAFGRDAWIVVAVQTRDVYRDQFVQHLRDLHDALARKVPNLKRVTSLVNARWVHADEGEIRVGQLLGDESTTPTSMRVLRERVRSNPLYSGTLVSRDGQMATLLVEPRTYSATLEDAGASERRYVTDTELAQSVAAIRAVAAEFDTEDFRVSYAGSPVVWDHLNHLVETDTARFFSLTVLVVGITTYLLVRSAYLTFSILLVSWFSLSSTLGAMAMLGIPLSATTQVLPSFLMTIGVCSAIHVVFAIRSRLADGEGIRQSIPTALRTTGPAVVFANLTTGLGLATFLLNPLPPVIHLGVAGLIGVTAVCVYSLTLIPIVLPRGNLAWAERGISRYLQRLPRILASGRPSTVVAFHAVLVAILVVGATGTRFSQDHMLWFPVDDPVRSAVRTMDAHLDGTVTVEVVVDSGRDQGMLQPALIRFLAQIGDAARLVAPPEFGPIKGASAANLVREVRGAMSAVPAASAGLPESEAEVAQSLLLLEMQAEDDVEIALDGPYRRGRVSIAVPWAESATYDRFGHDLLERLHPMVPDGASVVVTGEMPLLSGAFERLGSSLVRSFLVGFFVICLVMVVVLGDRVLGVLSILPNLVPILAMIGTLGWLGAPLDLSSLMAAATAIGIAVDDTIHFMYGVRRRLLDDVDTDRAVAATIEDVGPAMLCTSLVLAAGFSAFLLAYMEFIQTYGIILMVSIATAFLADISLAPAMIRLIKGDPRRRVVTPKAG